jgi:hypothetical protein
MLPNKMKKMLSQLDGLKAYFLAKPQMKMALVENIDV